MANIYLDPLDRELEGRGHSFSRYVDDCNIYVGSEPAAKRVMVTITEWITRTLRLKVNAQKSGIGRPWERKFLGFCLSREGAISVSAKSIERFKSQVRELWDARQSRTTKELRDQWQRYLRGWWNYYRLAEWRRPIFNLEGWVRRHIRKCFWLRWHNRKGRRNALMRLGLHGPLLKPASSRRGAWRVAKSPTLQTALRNSTLRHYGFWVPSDLARAEGA